MNVDQCYWTIFWMIKLEIWARLVLMNSELSYIHACKLKVPTFSCHVDNLILPIWPYQFFNILQIVDLNL